MLPWATPVDPGVRHPHRVRCPRGSTFTQSAERLRKPSPSLRGTLRDTDLILSNLDSMESMIEAGTQRLALRPWQAGDAAALSIAIAESAEHLRPWMSWIATEPRSLAERQAMIARWETERRAGGDMVFGMFIGGVVIGGCGLHRRLDADGLEIGYWVHAAHTRMGHATHAAEMLTSLAFSFREIHRVEIHCDHANRASQGVPRRLGFTQVGQQQKPFRHPVKPACKTCGG